MENFIKNEIAFYIANNMEECENFTSEDIEQVVKNTKDSIMNDNELNEVLNSTINWYVNKYIYNSELASKIIK